MRCFITGAAGFTGSHLAGELVAAGHDVTGLDDLSTGRRDSLRTNIHGTENVVTAAQASGARLLVASTSEIYGKNTEIGLCQDDDRVIGSPLKSRWGYAEAKAIDESLVDCYVRERGLRAVIVRFFIAATRNLDEIIQAVAAEQSSARQAA
jgi:nucleoside-diphosphate-sugar epimerase